jgi:hypothetical protein
MTVTNSAVLEALDVRKIQNLLESPGPCLTIALSAYHPGEAAEPVAALLKANAQEAAKQLSHLHFAKAATEDLLEPIERLADDPASLSGSHWGRVILRSPGVFSQFQLTQPAKASLTVAGCFSIRKLLSELGAARVFYILGVSKESVHLFKCDHQRMEAVALPAGVPATLQEALELEPPDHLLENRSPIGSSTGSMHAVRFGTGSGREAEHAHLADYYKLVDRGIQKLNHESGVPLLLAGVEQETAAYRGVSTYSNLVKESLAGSPKPSLQDFETVSRACSILRADLLRREAEALKEARERSAPGHVSNDTGTILHAAFEGRVHRLYLNENVASRDVFERGTYRSWGREDLLNLAAVQTLLHGGKALEFPGDRMADGVPAFAVMRF